MLCQRKNEQKQLKHKNNNNKKTKQKKLKKKSSARGSHLSPSLKLLLYGAITSPQANKRYCFVDTEKTC